jgi:hypothetical protein
LPTPFGLRCLLDAVVTGGKSASIYPLAIAARKIRMPPQLCDYSRHFGECSLEKIQGAHIALLQLKFAPEIRRGIDQNQ